MLAKLILYSLLTQLNLHPLKIPIVKEITKGRFVKTDKCTAKPAIQTFNPMQIETFPSWSVA